MAATADPNNAVDPIKPQPRRNYPAGYQSQGGLPEALNAAQPPALPAPVDTVQRRASTGIPVVDGAMSALNNLNAAGADIVDAPLGAVNQGLRAAFGEGIPKYDRNVRSLFEDTGAVNDATLSPDLQRRNGLFQPAPAQTPAADLAPSAPSAPMTFDPSAVIAGPQQSDGLPTGVSRRGDGIFEGRGAHGERAFADSGYAPQFAGVAGASPEAQRVYAYRFQQDRPLKNASGYDFQRARDAEIQAAGEDYKRYVAAGSPRTQDGRGLSEYDFLQRRQRNGLENFLDSEAGGSGTRASDRDGTSGGGRGRNPLSDAKTAQDIALGAAEGAISVEKGSLDVADRLRKRGDEAIAEGMKKYEGNPGVVARRYGAGVTPAEAAALDYAQTAIDAEGEDFLATPAGRAARAAAGKIAAREYNNRKYFESKRGLLTTEGLAQADPTQFSFKRNDSSFDPYEFTIEGPTFDRADKEGKRMVAEDDPNAERYPAQVGRRGLSGGRDAPEFISEQGLGAFISKLKIADKRKAERDKKK